MSSIGRYNLLASNDGKYAVEWSENNNYYRVVLPDFIATIDNMVNTELFSRRHFADIFNMALSNDKEEEFLHHPDNIIMNYVDNSIVPKNINKNDLRTFYIKRFLIAYNKWKGTSLKYSDVKQLCRDLS